MSAADTAAPAPLLDLRRSDSERLRVTLSEYRGRTLVDLRVWYSTETGEWKPGRAGVSLRPNQVGEVVQALMLAARSVDPKEGN
ncbi:transcriptional coactivator p15/PC4 family protein [Caballeronia sp. BCC1704]|uniref:transcriptional coactivator p15/PC4 family protein n=1 Tax=Caballeronia sp. BCC1704 TaxID=2676300 RepID=UPI0015890F5A|nr:transcriptional coactivator p15/PC4 family protein [Caballeronia sp. BCC1704]